MGVSHSGLPLPRPQCQQGGGNITTATYGASLSLTKTGNGEFVLMGDNAQQLLMEYFEKSPGLWLRLLAIKSGEDENESI